MLDVPGVEATNNRAERAHRCGVLWRKRSQGTCSEKGNRWVERIGAILLMIVAVFVMRPLVHPSISGAGQGMLFGWAKPVPVNYHALRKPKRDMMWVAAAGPGANLVMALGWALTAKLALVLPNNYFTDPLFLISQAGVTVNLVLMLLNLIPLLPLDGGRIVAGLLPTRMADEYAEFVVDPEDPEKPSRAASTMQTQ